MNRADIERVTMGTEELRAEQIAQLRVIFPEVVSEGTGTYFLTHTWIMRKASLKISACPPGQS